MRLSPGSIRVVALASEQCPHCGGTLKILAALEPPPGMAKTLTPLGVSARADHWRGHALSSIRPDRLLIPLLCGSAPEPTLSPWPSLVRDAKAHRILAP